ncbi:matrix-remodeling-associated protein 5 [Archocentrus centrarchus]|uniref:matrix-remodeling-associated protein 5 n=1 Tax=Archocentrus centrarchus TaxID=63155 RepID=UPI0011EA088A|nr:matrix-remodeling-associated protein 5 [Archocentrus centrarchus]
MKMDPPALFVLNALLVLIIFSLAASGSCPRPCSCPQSTELHCTFRSLLTIPAAIPKLVKHMNLGFNRINKIADKSLAGLRKLELLMVHGNDIHDLPDGVFRELISLQMLKISYNKLKEIRRHTLQGLWSVARLHLDHNRLEFIHPDAFQGLTSLRLLQLEGNQLQQLHPETFTTFTVKSHFHVSTLRHLYLSDNGLTSVPSRLMATMPQLENLYLDRNPWMCDCSMRWLHDWDKKSPGVLKCKKDRTLPGGQLCPMCSSPRHLQAKDLLDVENLVCSSPVITIPHRMTTLKDAESKDLTTEDFKEPFGNISLALSDEHGNEVDLECSVSKSRELTKITWEQNNQLQLTSNITVTVDLECPVDREKYEKLWRLIAYYSNIPAHLQRGVILSKGPHPTYLYIQDSEKDVLYYTGVKVNMTAQPTWLMQTSVALQLNRLQTSARMAKLIMSTNLSETVEVELMQKQRRSWVMIESTNTTRKVFSAILGKQSQMYCNVHSSGQRVIRWVLPDGSKVEAPYSSPDSRLSVSSGGSLVIKAVRHTDTGIYYCIARSHGDFAVLPFYLTVQESSSPPPGEETSITPTEGFAGNPISLPCAASGSPDAEINWILPSSKIVSFQANSPRASVYSNGTLHIPQSQLSDSGYYKCIAMNQHGVDTLTTKMTVVRHKGLISPLRKFPATPQSASGVNTQIKIPTKDTDDASEDSEGTQEAVPKRRPGGVAPGRRGIHPSRKIWRRPPVLQKSTGSRVAVRMSTADRKRINLSKGKIDPQKWAHILAKIRERKAQNTTTPLPVQQTNERKAAEQTTESEETTEGSSDDVTEQKKQGRDFFRTLHTPVQYTQMKTDEQLAQSQETQVTSNSNSAHNARKMSSSQHSTHSSTEPLITQSTHSVEYIKRDIVLDLHTSSNSVFFLPQTTSVPLHAVTLWQSLTNTASSTFSLQENQSTNTDVNGDKTADWSKVSERHENTDRLNVAASSSNDNEPFSRSQIITSVNPSKSMTSREENGKYPSETVISQLQSLEDAPDDLQSVATASPTTTRVPMTLGWKGSERRSSPRLQEHKSRRRNGSQRRRPNRRKQKLIKPIQFAAITPAKALLATIKTTASTLLKILPTQVTTANPSTIVPFTGSQTASSGRVSHKESTVSRHDHEAATKPSSLPASPIETKDSHLPLAKPLFKSTVTATSFPTTFPEVDHRKTTSQTALGISESPSPPEHFSVPTATTLHRFISSPAPPISLSEEAQRPSVMGDLGPRPSSDTLFVGFYTTNATRLQRDGEENQSGQQYTANEEMLLNETEMGFSPVPSTVTTDTTFIDQVIKTTSGYTSSELNMPPSILSKDYLETDLDTTQTPTVPENSYYSSSQNKTSTESKAAQNLKEPLNEKVDLFSPTISAFKTTTPPPTTSIKITLHPTLPKISFTEAKKDSSVRASMQEAPWITVSHGEDQQKNPNINISEPWTELYVHPTTQSPGHKPASSSPAMELTSRQTVIQTVTPAPNATVQTNLYREGLLTSTQDVSRKYQVPKQESIPRGKPRITKSNFQTLTVKAETDAQLPCETEGDPKPFLSWTKAASGASIAQNTTVQRFEVHPNGTLIIRNTQLLDSGQYLCTVQNQYGTDMMGVNLVVLSQQPRVLHPQHREITVHLGGKVSLECKVEGHPVPQVTWVLPNHVHIAAASASVLSQQHVVVSNDGTLQLNQASSTDRGIYKCIASSAAGADSVSVHLRVLALPPVIQQSLHETTTLSERSPAYIHCTATGSPPPFIHWITPDGAHLTASLDIGQNLIVFPNGTLYIRSMGTENAGRYECSATNTAASSRRTVMLSIRRNPLSSAKPNIASSSTKRTDVIYGSKLLLNCVATGQPKPRIIWRTPSKKLVDVQYSFDSRIKVFPNGTLSVLSVTDKDSGDYLCVARNKMGDDYVLLRVNVLTRPAKIEQKLQQSSQEVVYGADLKVDCVASGLPNPEISWMLPDGTMVNLVKQRDGIIVGRSRRYVVFDNGTLYFNNVRMPEAGDYTCYAENQLGKDEMKVRVKIKAAPSLPQIHNKDPQTVRVFYGETVTLRCNAKGEPAPVITWISPINKVIFPALDKYQVLDDGTLVVQKIQRFDGGNYTCIARNRAGQDQKVTRLEVLVTPPVIVGLRGTPNAIKVTAVQNQQKLLDCMAKGTPTPRIMWVLPGNVTLPAPYYSNRILVHQNGTLEIRSPKETDSGQLVCIARNEGGEVRLVVNLDVKTVVERPQIRGPKTNVQSLTVGNAMALNCSFEGSALLPVTWILPSGTPLHSGARFSKFFHQPNGSLIISNPSVADAGMYRCMIHNSGDVVEHTVTLSLGRKPEISNRYNSPVSVINGENLLLHCQTTGEALRLVWTLPSGAVLNRVQRAGRYTILPNGTLAIQQVSIHDRGPYICRASNEYGSSLLSVSVIVIAHPPQITSGPPSVTYAKRGVAVQLNCVATGIPKVEVTWETPDKIRLAVSAQPHLFGNKYLHPRGSLIIQNPTQRDTGIYQCTARNAIGMDSKATFLNVF